MIGPNKSVEELNRLGAKAANEAEQTNYLMNGSPFGGRDRMHQSIGRDNLIKVPFAIVGLGLVVLGVGIAGYAFAGTIGMWIGMVFAGIGGFGAIAWFEARKK